MAFRGSALRPGHGALAAALALLSLGGLANSTPRIAARRATVHVAVHYDGAAFWRGSFREVRLDGRVVALGRVLDRPRQKLGADWSITRKLTSRAGTLEFRISGPYQTPTARLHWLIVGGTGAYAALNGHGVDVEHVNETTATAAMQMVPLP